jgi:hypothetical protein
VVACLCTAPPEGGGLRINWNADSCEPARPCVNGLCFMKEERCWSQAFEVGMMVA